MLTLIRSKRKYFVRLESFPGGQKINAKRIGEKVCI